MTNLGERLMAEHQHLDELFEDLVNRVHTGDCAIMSECWREFEDALVAHMAFEERRLLVDFAEHHPAEAAWVRADHVRIRALLDELGVELQIHLLSDQRAADFIAMLRSHAEREAALLYRWATTHRPGAADHWQPTSAGPSVA